MVPLKRLYPSPVPANMAGQSRRRLSYRSAQTAARMGTTTQLPPHGRFPARPATVHHRICMMWRGFIGCCHVSTLALLTCNRDSRWANELRAVGLLCGVWLIGVRSSFVPMLRCLSFHAVSHCPDSSIHIVSCRLLIILRFAQE